MHTIFINTTKNVIGWRFDSLNIAKDLKKLMYVDYPLDRWNSETKGYETVVQQIAEHNDTYSYVSDDFNLIIYVDMIDVFDLIKVNYFDADDSEKTLLVDACKAAIVRLISETLIKKLNADERTPAEMPVLLLGMPKVKELPSGVDKTKQQVEAMMKVLGFASMEQMNQKLADKDKTQVEITDLLDESKKDVQFNLYSIYRKYAQIMIDSVRKDGVPVERASDNFYRSVTTLHSSDCIHNLMTSEFHSNQKTITLSKEARTKHSFLLQCFILSCVNDKSVFDREEKVKQIKELSDSDWDKIKLALCKKRKKYEIQQRKIDALNVDYTKLGFAPPLHMLARESFGLNESGNISREYAVRETEKENNVKSKAKDKDDKQKDPEDKSDVDSLMKNESELVEQRGIVKNWLDNSVYKKYDSSGDEYIANMGSATADEYCARATDLANHHLNIFNKLNMHIKRTMSNYSCHSTSNMPPILRKRSVNMGESAADSDKNDYIYAKRNGGEIVKETEPTETIVETSKRSYVSIMLEYLKFDAGRGIMMRGIKDQAEWFINRIKQLEKSLKKLIWIFAVMMVALAVVYMPFVLIQWHSIVKGVDTVVIALASIGIPYGLLFLIYCVCRVLQKRKMKTAWEKLVEVSNEASEENRRLISAYDEMMTRYIPALRWLYEYVLDVDFHCDCCAMARAKLAHHNKKLSEISEDLNNLLEDLDYPEEYEGDIPHEDFVEYTNAFCDGEKNIEFYSIIDKELLRIINNEEGGID